MGLYNLTIGANVGKSKCGMLEGEVGIQIVTYINLGVIAALVVTQNIDPPAPSYFLLPGHILFIPRIPTLSVSHQQHFDYKA